jgi:GTP 3',8-cyclase
VRCGSRGRGESMRDDRQDGSGRGISPPSSPPGGDGPGAGAGGGPGAVRYLRISVTDRCDLRCTYCTPMRTAAGAPRADLLTYEEIGQVARVAATLGVRKIRVTGGEPLGRPGVAWLLADLATVPGITERGLTTNGTRLAAFVPGLARDGWRVNVHLDSLGPARYRASCGGGSPAPVVEALEAARAAGIRLKINAVCTGATDVADAVRLARFGLERGVDVRFIESMPVSGTDPDPESRASMAALEAGLREALGLVPDGTDGMARVHRAPGFDARVGFITPSHARFCAGCDKLRLSSRGRLRTCLFAGDGTDLRALVRAGDAGGLHAAMAAAMARKAAGEGREGCAIRTMVGIGG